MSKTALVADIRSASRDLVREFGLMNRTVAGTDLSLSAVHAIIEIGRANGLSAKDLSAFLRLEKSSVSRLVKSLLARGEVREEPSPHDGRSKLLRLTPQGLETLRSIDQFADARVTSALSAMPDTSVHAVLKGLQDYAGAMNKTSEYAGSGPANVPVDINVGYAPGLIGQTVAMMQKHMNHHHGFGAHFECRIATDMAEFASRLDSPRNEIWRAEINGRLVGSVSIDGEDLGDNLAHLRWFVVSEDVRGRGVGKALLAQALTFCDELEVRETHLWTVKGLDAARYMYEKSGFLLAEEYIGDQWGDEITEYKLVRPAP